MEYLDENLTEYGHVGINSILMATLFLGGYSIPFMTTADIQANLGTVLAVLFGICAFLALAFLHMVYRWLRAFNKGQASNKAEINREYLLYKTIAWIAVPVFIALAIVSGLFIHPEATMVNGLPIYGIGTALGTAALQFLVLMIKTVFFCWVWIWVRWTLPRFRYDQIMHLGWKILLNIALLNLVVTAIIAKLVMGGN